MKDTKNKAEQVWPGLIGRIIQEGEQVTPRPSESALGDQSTKELIDAHCMVDMEFPVITCAARKISYKFMLAEALWILSGSDKLDEIAPFNERMKKFSDDGETLAGAYGPRVKAQMQYIIGKLIEDRDSRQAVLIIWKENPPESRDIPCTIDIQFLIRNGYVHTIVNMRSSDIWLGWPYDVFNFTMITMYLLLTLRTKYAELKLGYLCFRAGSLHLYDRDANKAHESLLRPSIVQLTPLNPAEFNGAGDLLEWLKMMRDGQVSRVKKAFMKEVVK